MGKAAKKRKQQNEAETSMDSSASSAGQLEDLIKRLVPILVPLVTEAVTKALEPLIARSRGYRRRSQLKLGRRNLKEDAPSLSQVSKRQAAHRQPNDTRST